MKSKAKPKKKVKLKRDKKSMPGETETNAKQEMFCQLYATNREFFGNGVESYLEVYNPDRSKPNWYKTACSSASQLLSNIKVYTRINELLESDGLNNTNVDKQILMLINQHADFSAKVAAIREYNKLKQRIVEKIDHTTKGQMLPIQVISYKDVTKKNDPV